MIKRSSYARHAHALIETETRIEADPDCIEPRFDRARLLTELGRVHEAQQAYLDILARDPTHFGTLNNLGVLLHQTGYRTAARTVYAETVARHPDNPKGHINFAHALLDENDVIAARAHYGMALRFAPDNPAAHQGLAKLFTMIGDEEQALLHRHLGFQKRALIALPYRGEGTPLPVLFVISAAGGNVPIRQFLDDRIFLVSVVVAEFYDDATPLPPHSLVINAIGDADLCRAGLDAAAKIIARTQAPVINPPSAVLATGRVANAKRLSSIENLIAPRAESMSKALLEGKNALAALTGYGFSFPFLLRTPGYHTGHYFVRVDNEDEFSVALKTLPGSELVVMQYLNARGADGSIRKYRVMIIDGRLYPLHAAVSPQWKVHYFSADMKDNAEHRAEDEAFLDNMSDVLGVKAMHALERVVDALQLDYGGIDFGLSADGKVILFEANATMVVTSPGPEECWHYRRAPVEQVFEAIRRMFKEKAAPARRRS
jgi:glutathione synthase/RimK-type ligase-like ATP-grasp enzyme